MLAKATLARPLRASDAPTFSSVVDVICITSGAAPGTIEGISLRLNQVGSRRRSSGPAGPVISRRARMISTPSRVAVARDDVVVLLDGGGRADDSGRALRTGRGAARRCSTAVARKPLPMARSRTTPETTIVPGSAWSQRRAASCTVAPNRSSPSATGSPALMPIRTLRSGSFEALCSAKPRWMSTALWSAACTEPRDAMIPSPVCFTSLPSWRARASRTMPSWMRRSRTAPSSPRRCARAVEPSRSVKRTVRAREPSSACAWARPLRGAAGATPADRVRGRCRAPRSTRGADRRRRAEPRPSSPAPPGPPSGTGGRSPGMGPSAHEGARGPLRRRQLRPARSAGSTQRRTRARAAGCRRAAHAARGSTGRRSRAGGRGAPCAAPRAPGPRRPPSPRVATADSASWIALAAASRSMATVCEREADLRSALDRRRPENAPELRQQDAERRLRPRRQLPRPERLDQLVAGHRSIAVRRQVDQEQSGPGGPADRRRSAGRPPARPRCRRSGSWCPCALEAFGKGVESRVQSSLSGGDAATVAPRTGRSRG